MTRVLVVDDKDENLYYLEALFKGHGHAVTTARHGAEALVKARQEAPDIVVSDLLMPVMDGYTLLRQWKLDDRLAPIPFVVYTAAYTEIEDEQLALQLGAAAFILKPCEPEVFIAKIAEVLARGPGADTEPPVPPPGADGDLMAMYSSTLVRKLEQKTLQLEEANRALQESAQRIRRLNRVYAVLSQINALIVRAGDRRELFEEACRIAVVGGGFRMSMIAVLDPQTRRIAPVASAGKDEGLLDAVRRVLASEEDAPRSLVARVMRDRTALVINDIAHDDRLLLSGDYASAGVRSLVVLPLLVAGEAVGVLALYAGEVGYFHDEEMKLLDELAGDVAFAIDHIDKRERLEFLALYDALTGLANRALFIERVAQFLRGAGAGERLAVMQFDIERFKNINDSLGHVAGDALLREAAARLTAITGDANLLARVGADRFACVAPALEADEDALSRCERVLERFAEQPFAFDGEAFKVAAKAGIALWPQDGDSADALFRNAEAALKKAKSGSVRYLRFDRAMTDRVASNLTLENQLHAAFANEQFVLHYQPQVDMASGRLVGAEALLRWNDPRAGLVQPLRFIPMLEEIGLIHEVGRWALHQAARDHLRWRRAGLPPIRVAVNVSPMQLRHRGFVAQIAQLCAGDAGAAAGLELEITESMVMEDIEHGVATLQAIRALGVAIALDDFGTGFSSLSYLARLPVDVLKIDRSFVNDMTSGPDALSLVTNIVTLAHSLKLKVVAEGVETEEQAELLRALRCDAMQGFLFSMPLPAEEFERRFVAATVAGA